MTEETATAAESADTEIVEDQNVENATEETPSDTESDETVEAAEETEEVEIDPKVEQQQKKIAELSYKEREAKRQIAHLNKMLEQSQQIADRASKQEELKPPKIEDFDSIDDFVDAKVEYAFNLKQQGQSEKTAETAAPAGTASPDVDELYAEGIEKHPDFAEVVGAEHVRITSEMADAILNMDEMGVQVDAAYFLGNNPKEALRISKLPPVRQIQEITRLGDKLATKAAPKKKPSAAPKPINPVGGKKTTNDEIAPTEDYESFLKKRNKQLGRG